MAVARVRSWTGIWPLIVAVGVVTSVWMAAAGLTLAWRDTMLLILTCIGLETLAAFYRSWRPDHRLAATLTALAQLVAFSAIGAALSYAAAATGGRLWDETFASWDRAFGFDWRHYLDLLDTHPQFGSIYALAYESLSPQIIIVVTVLGFSGRVTKVQEFVLAFIMAGTTSIVLSGVLPAMGTYVWFGLEPQDFPHFSPAAPYDHVADYTGLRDGSLRVVSLLDAKGIITFPSFHAALGVIFAAALWPFRWLRWPAVALNLLLVAATPLEGGHYGVDVLAGVAIAALSVAAARRLTHWAEVESPLPIGRALDGSSIGV